MSKDSLPAVMALAQAILLETVTAMRFVTCSCGNDQPFIRGRGAQCESCGKRLLTKKASETASHSTVEQC